MELAEVIAVSKNYELKHYFPSVEMTGGHQLTIPLNFNLKMMVFYTLNIRMVAFLHKMI